MHSFKSRAKARKYAMQALYSWVISQSDVHEVEAFYLADRNPNNFEVPYFHQILHDTAANLNNIDEQITQCINRPFKDISAIELTILRVATYEMLYSLEVPFKVIISEALELTKTFGHSDSHKFINSVLDRMSKVLRSTERLPEEITKCPENTILESSHS